MYYPYCTITCILFMKEYNFFTKTSENAQTVSQWNWCLIFSIEIFSRFKNKQHIVPFLYVCKDLILKWTCLCVCIDVTLKWPNQDSIGICYTTWSTTWYIHESQYKKMVEIFLAFLAVVPFPRFEFLNVSHQFLQ